MSLRLSVVVGTLAASAWTSPSMAYNEEDLQRLIKTNSCKGCDLTGAGLFQVDLTSADLSDANLSSAFLAFAYLKNANLRGANLTGANLSYTILTGATWVDGRICAEGSVGECKE